METGLRDFTKEIMDPLGKCTFSVRNLPIDDYILILGGCNNTDGTGGKMYITGTPTAKRETVYVNFSTNIPFSNFLDNGGPGYDVDFSINNDHTNIVEIFGNHS